MGFNMVLYNKILFVSKSLDFRPMNQYICRVFRTICICLVSMSFCLVSDLSRCNPIYLMSAFIGISVLFLVTGGQVLCRLKVLQADLVMMTSVLHLLYHSASRFRWVWRLSVATCGFSLVDNKATLSTKDVVVVAFV